MFASWYLLLDSKESANEIDKTLNQIVSLKTTINCGVACTVIRGLLCRKVHTSGVPAYLCVLNMRLLTNSM